MVAALRRPEAAVDQAAVDKALKVHSFVVTPKQVLAEYEKQTEAAWKVEYIPLTKLKEEEKRLWDEGNPRATVITLRRIWTEGGTLYEKTDNEALEAESEHLETLEVVLKRVLQGQ